MRSIYPPLSSTGVIFVLLGVAAILFPMTAGVATELLFGGILVAASLTYLFGMRTSRIPSQMTHLMIAALFLLTGVGLIILPAIGVFSMELIVGAGFFIQGIVQLTDGLGVHYGRGNAVLIISGVVGIVAGGAILLAWPFAAAWVFGAVVGFNLIMVGLTILFLRGGFTT